MAQVYKDANGKYIAIKRDGTAVPVLPNLMKGAQISGFSPVINSPGATGFQRFTVKNLCNTPELARGYLEKVGYEVRDFGGGFNFAVRPKGSGTRVPWKVIDPDGFDPQDLFDLTGDAVSLGAQALASIAVSPSLATGPGGMAIEAGAVAGAAAGVEGLRQIAGGMAGVPDQGADPGRIAASAAGGAVSVPIGRGISGATRGAGRFLGKIARGVGARFAGIEGSRALPGADALLDAAEWSVHNPGMLMKTPEEAAQIVKDAVRGIAGKTFPEKAEALNLASQAASGGTTLNLRPLVDDIQSEMLGTVGTVAVPGSPNPARLARTPELQVKHGVHPDLEGQLESVVATVYALVRNDSIGALPIDRAVLVKNYLQQIARQKGAYAQTPPGKAFRDIVTHAAEGLRGDIESAMANAGFPQYKAVMNAFEHKTNLLHDWSKALRVKDKSSEAIAHRVRFIRSLYSESKVNWLSALDDLETTFGVQGLKQVAREAHVGRVTGMSQEGGPSLLGRGARSTLGLGALVFGHPAAAAVELGVTSPKVVLGATKAGLRAGKIAGPLTAAASRGGAALVAQKSAQAVGKGTSRDDAATAGPTKIGL